VDILTLLVYWNYIDEKYQVGKVEGDSYNRFCGLKNNRSKKIIDINPVL